MPITPHRAQLAIPTGALKIKYLSPQEVDTLTYTFQNWFDQAPMKGKKREIRGRYWLVYLVLRFTGARLGEVTQLNDTNDIDYRAAELMLITLKRRDQKPKRIVPVPSNVVSEIATYLASYPNRRGTVFNIDPNNFRKTFYQMASEAKILTEEIDTSTGAKHIFPHPHTLRHTRAIELIRAGIPVPAVQDLLGHSSILTTAQYVRLSGQEAKQMMKNAGLL